MSAPLRVGLVAGEASGDTVGADLISAMLKFAPDTQFFGVAGPKMQAAGCEVWEPAESLAVMGLFEIVRHLPRLLRLRAQLRGRFLRLKPDVFVGIDAPEFNLRLARNLRAAGIPTVQYVSPQVWAWRQGRARSIHESVDLVLCLLPFEKRFYDAHGMHAEFVGHPLADAIPLVPDRQAARRSLDIDANAEVGALLPGSRRGDGALARRAAPAVGIHRADGERGGAGDFRSGARAPRAGPRNPAHRGSCTNRADRRRCRDGRLRNRELGGCPVQTSHGGGLPAGGDDGLGSAPAESGQIQIFCATKSACGSARRRRVFSGRYCP